MDPRTRRCLAATIGALLTIATVGGCAAMWADEGTWYCRVCCSAEERTAGVLGVAREELEPSDPDFDFTRNFHEWFQRSVALEHDHDWTPSGCHHRGRSVVCSDLVSDSTFHRSVPVLPDQELARELVARLIARETEDRCAMLSELQREPGPFATVAARKPVSSADFAAAYEAWSAAHPLWR